MGAADDDKQRHDGLAQRLQRLEDRFEIMELTAKYGMFLDERNLEDLVGLFARDAVIESAGGGGQGHEGVLEYYRWRLSQYGPTFHYPHSQTIHFVDNDEATGVVNAHAEIAMDDGAFVTALRYLDRYVREDEAWCFHERRALQLYALPLDQLAQRMGDPLRKRWPDTEPAPADFPEPLQTWKAFWELQGQRNES